VRPDGPGCSTSSTIRRWQALSSGQKTLLRMGPVNQRRIKARLAEIRRLVTAGSVPR